METLGAWRNGVPNGRLAGVDVYSRPPTEEQVREEMSRLGGL